MFYNPYKSTNYSVKTQNAINTLASDADHADMRNKATCDELQTVAKPLMINEELSADHRAFIFIAAAAKAFGPRTNNQDHVSILDILSVIGEMGEQAQKIAVETASIHPDVRQGVTYYKILSDQMQSFIKNWQEESRTNSAL